MKTRVMNLVIAAWFGLGAPGASGHQLQPACTANVLIEWNESVLSTALAEDGLLTLKGVRTAAMMHVAMHDAINSIHRHYSHYAFSGHAAGADPVIAAAQAAYTVAASQYPDHEDRFARDLQRWVMRAASEEARRNALEVGRAAALAILERRANDRWNGDAEYRFQPRAPGVYADFPEHSGTPARFVFGAGWALVQPFTLQRPDQFRSPPPPAITSREYAVAYDEVRTLGRHRSRARTADQTHLALWWKDFAENSHNRLARAIVADRGTELWSAARMFALLNMSLLDGYVAVFEAKLAYNHWRPYTAIHEADRDENPRTHPEPAWTNTHRHTYPFPSYPSAHGTVCAAAMTVLADTFGSDQSFTMITREVAAAGPQSPLLKLQPAARTFVSFDSAALECALSRVYLGIHFRYDSLAGNRLGREVARHALQRYLVPAR